MVKVEVKDLPNCKKILNVRVSREEVDSCLEEIYRDIGKKAVIPGFRKGKAPRELVVGRYQDRARQELLERLIPRTYRQAVAQSRIRPVTLPEISRVKLDEKEPLTFRAEVEVQPEVNLKSYLGLPVREMPAEVKPEEVERALADLRERNARYPTVRERGVRLGDYLVVDLNILAGGRSIERKKNVWIQVGAEAGIPGFAERMAEAKTGEEREFTFVLPENFPRKEFAGKEAAARVRVKEIKEKTLPELNDEFARQVNGGASLAELKELIRKNLLEQARIGREKEKEEQLFEQLLLRADFEVPESLVQIRLEELMKTAVLQLYYRGVSSGQIESRKEKLRENLRAGALKQVKLYFLLLEIARKEGIEAENKEIEKRINRIAGNRKQTPEAVRSELEEKGLLESLKEGIVREKVRDFLLKNARVTK